MAVPLKLSFSTESRPDRVIYQSNSKGFEISMCGRSWARDTPFLSALSGRCSPEDHRAAGPHVASIRVKRFRPVNIAGLTRTDLAASPTCAKAAKGMCTREWHAHSWICASNATHAALLSVTLLPPSAALSNSFSACLIRSPLPRLAGYSSR